MCQELAERAGQEDENGYFTVGLLSTLDALAKAPMEKVLEHLPLSGGLQQALLQESGPLGEALACVRAYEAGDFAHAHFAALDPISIRDAYFAAVEYSGEVWGNFPQ
jgi:EAL and modified HD-GYP domain-containing signal transduction protein